jgi:hypothetical protein
MYGFVSNDSVYAKTNVFMMFRLYEKGEETMKARCSRYNPVFTRGYNEFFDQQ